MATLKLVDSTFDTSHEVATETNAHVSTLELSTLATGEWRAGRWQSGTDLMGRCYALSFAMLPNISHHN